MKKKVKCWELFACEEHDCPVYKTKELRCWLVSGTHCRNEIQGRFLEKLQMCLECEPFIANMDADAIQATLEVVDRQLKEFSKIVEARDRELAGMNRELGLGLAEVSAALKRIASGDPEVRVSEASQLESIAKLKHLVNLTAEELGEIVELSHEFAMGLAEHFDVLHRVSAGDLSARVTGKSQLELLELLKSTTNDMIETISREIAERTRAEEALRRAHDELEMRVKDRTIELSKANALLRREVGERQRAEQTCRNINLELNNFVHIISHDLRTPIIAIQGFSSRLLKQAGETVGEEWGRHLQQIKCSADRMEALLSDLLEVSRTGHAPSNFRDVSSYEIVQRVASSLEQRLKEKGVRLLIADTLPKVHGDEEKLYRVFENLMVNAMKFSRTDRVPEIEIGCNTGKDFHEFYVKDNGVGIEPKDHERIFEMFHRLRQNDQEGTGIGLTIVRRIVTDHGGKVWVDSKKGEGAVFYFTLPKN